MEPNPLAESTESFASPEVEPRPPGRRETELPTLRQRLFRLFVRWFGVFLTVVAVGGGYLLVGVRERLAADQEQLTRTVAAYVDSTLAGLVHDLDRLASELPLDASTEHRLRAFRLRGLFRDGIYLLDAKGSIVAADPPFDAPRSGGWPVEVVGRRGFHLRRDPVGLVAVAPFRREGREYSLVATSNLAGSQLSVALQGLVADRELHLAVTDAEGTVIAAPDQGTLGRTVPAVRQLSHRLETGRAATTNTVGCDVCPGDERGSGRFLTILVPLEVAPWTIALQMRSSTLWSAYGSFRAELSLALLLVVSTGLLLSRSFSQSVIAPIRNLSRQAERLRHGDLLSPIRTDGDREIQILASSLDEARRRIAASLRKLRELNEGLEALVDRRTGELRTRLRDLHTLLEVSKLANQERDLEVFVPEVLRLVSRRFGSGPVALAIELRPGDRRIFQKPLTPPLLWLERGENVPSGWTVRPLMHLGQKLGDLALRHPDSAPEPVLDALQHELSGALHAIAMRDRIVASNERRRELVRRLLTAGEEERQRIARELHDEISQLLTVIQLSLEQVADGDEREVERAQNLLARTQEEIHRIIFDLRPSLLDDLGLASAVQWYAATATARGIAVHLELQEGMELPDEVEITAFRIFQESLTNVLRHAGAQNVSIELYRDTDRLTLIVEDDGQGFDVEQQRAGSGLLGMRERAALVGGTVAVDSEPGAGTTIHVTLPLEAGP